jgi:hypothetical protein
MLLFLNTIESIEISHWAQGDAQPTKRFACVVSNSSTAQRATRAFVKEKTRHERAITQGKEFTADHTLLIECTHYGATDSEAAGAGAAPSGDNDVKYVLFTIPVPALSCHVCQ